MLQKIDALTGTRSSGIHPTSPSLDSAPPKSAGATHQSTVLKIYVAIEFLVIACAAYLGSTIYHFVTFATVQTDSRYIFAAVVIATLVLLVSVGFHNFFEFRKQPRHLFLWRGIGAVALAFSTFLTILFFTQYAEQYSRGSLIFQIVTVSVAVVSARALFYSWLRTAIASDRINARRVILFGDVSHCSKFASRLKASGIQTIGAFRLPESYYKNSMAATNRAIRKIIDELRSLRADDIIILGNNHTFSGMFDIASSLAELPSGIHVVPIDALNALASSQIVEFGNLQTIQVYRPPLSAFDQFIKRAFDLTIATIGLIVLSPLLLIVSIAIKLDSPGPVLFRQTRHGFNNDEICVFKFRSMTLIKDGGEFTQAMINDPRVTHVGHILRKTNIDELPQLMNVLLGEMSIVGPRPHATAHNAQFSDIIAPFSRRHNVKPGITGWAQVNGCRGATDTFEKMHQRIEHDLYYIDNWSFLLDVKIILMTLFSRRAYLNAY